jgi:aryl-alcohol dehydrogenase-like predicted oxidoreductase
VATGDIRTTKWVDRWANTAESNTRASSTASTKAEVQASRRRLAMERGVEYLVHRVDGTIGERNTYPRSRDPGGLGDDVAPP